MCAEYAYYFDSIYLFDTYSIRLTCHRLHRRTKLIYYDIVIDTRIKRSV